MAHLDADDRRAALAFDARAWLALCLGVPGGLLCSWLAHRLGAAGPAGLFEVLAPIGFIGAVVPCMLPRERILGWLGMVAAAVSFLTGLGYLAMILAFVPHVS